LTDADINYAKRTIQEIINRFKSNQYEYESSEYIESQLRTDFIDELFKALGWDIINKNKLSRLQREVLVEKGDTTGRPDYSFRVNGQDRFLLKPKHRLKALISQTTSFKPRVTGGTQPA
jgi:predicted type IV restriction endonuclease